MLELKEFSNSCRLDRDRVGLGMSYRFVGLFPREWDGKEQKLNKGQRERRHSFEAF